MTRVLVVLVAIMIAILGGLIHARSASAQEACSAWINGEEADGETIEVNRDSDVTVTVSIPDEADRNVVYLEFLGYRHEVDSGPSEGGEWDGTVPVEDLAIWGVGLYKLVWESRDAGDEVLCRRSASIDVEGSPLRSVAGVAGVAAIVVGLTALTFTWRITINEGARWAIKMVGRGKVDKDEERDRLRIRPTFSVSQTLLGTLWGLLLAGGTLTTLQETALRLPTIEMAVELIVPFAVLGLLAGSFRLVRE